MEWITGITRSNDSGLCVEVQDAAGIRTHAELKDVGASLGVPKRGRRSVTFSLHTLQRVSADEYLAGLAMPHLVAGCQSVYEVHDRVGVLLIPAQLLVLSVLGNHEILREALFRPCPPSIWSTAVTAERALRMSPVFQSSMSAQARRKKIPLKLEWILSYPSAYAAWASVYRHALSGRFDMDMPRATVKFVIWAQRSGGKWLVTKLRLQELLPDEPPFDFAEGKAATEFVYMDRHDGRPFPVPSPKPTQDSRVVAQQVARPMTDAEWALMEPKLDHLFPVRADRSGGQRRHSLRTLVDVILLKLGKPYSWSNLPVDKSLSNSASVLLSKLKRAGVWDEIVNSHVAGLSPPGAAAVIDPPVLNSPVLLAETQAGCGRPTLRAAAVISSYPPHDS